MVTGVVLHELLLVEHSLLVELPQHALDDFGAEILGLLLFGHLGFIDPALANR